jgi:hypothetical protein
MCFFKKKVNCQINNSPVIESESTIPSTVKDEAKRQAMLYYANRLKYNMALETIEFAKNCTNLTGEQRWSIVKDIHNFEGETFNHWFKELCHIVAEEIPDLTNEQRLLLLARCPDLILIQRVLAKLDIPGEDKMAFRTRMIKQETTNEEEGTKNK